MLTKLVNRWPASRIDELMPWAYAAPCDGASLTAKIEARAKERYARELAEHEAKLAACEAKEKATGKKPGGKPPAPPAEGPLPGDQVNLTGEESRIMPVSSGGFEQCYNAQAVVAEDSLLVVANGVTQAPNDKRELEPMLAKTSALPEEKTCWPITAFSAKPM